MPIPAFMSIEGARQGNITAGASTEKSVGNIFVAGHENEILVQAFSHRVDIPCDPQSGQPTGQRVHQTVNILKVFDQSSPLLYTALTTGERLSKCRIRFYRISAAGAQEYFFTVEFEDAVIVAIAAGMPDCHEGCNQHFTHLEQVSFAYRKIMWRHEATGTSGSDDWRVQR